MVLLLDEVGAALEDGGGVFLLVGGQKCHHAYRSVVGGHAAVEDGAVLFLGFQDEVIPLSLIHICMQSLIYANVDKNDPSVRVSIPMALSALDIA